METNSTTTIIENRNITNNYHYHHDVTHKPHNHSHHDIFPSTSILIVILPIIIVILLFSIILILLMLKRLKSEHGKGANSKNSNGFGNGDCMLSRAHSIIDINASPDIKGGCLYKGKSISSRVPSRSYRFSRVQVYTYKELESATDRFSEENVIGNGGFGVVYKGVLKDGNVAAVKRLHEDGKQGERAFRIEQPPLLSLLRPTPLLASPPNLHHYRCRKINIFAGVDAQAGDDIRQSPKLSFTISSLVDFHIDGFRGIKSFDFDLTSIYCWIIIIKYLLGFTLFAATIYLRTC